ncbi:MAG: hypothetical protein R3A50_11775 [Saprospiraceae bacterium]
MTGAISEAYYKSIPASILDNMNEYLPKPFRQVIEAFEEQYGM